MLSESIGAQAYALCVTVVAGAAIGLAFDFYRALRALVRPGRAATVMGDLLFWIAATALVFRLLLASTWGEVRFYVFVGIGVGALCYRVALGMPVGRGLACCVRLLRLAGARTREAYRGARESASLAAARMQEKRRSCRRIGATSQG